MAGAITLAAVAKRSLSMSESFQSAQVADTRILGNRGSASSAANRSVEILFVH